MNSSPPMFNIIVFFVLFCFSFGPIKHSDMLGFNTIEIYMKIESVSSQMREMLLFLSINTAAVTTCANQQLF